MDDKVRLSIEQLIAQWRTESQEQARRLYSHRTVSWDNIRTIEGRMQERCANELDALLQSVQEQNHGSDSVRDNLRSVPDIRPTSGDVHRASTEVIADLPKHLLWRLVDRFERHDRSLDADDEYIKLSDLKAALLQLESVRSVTPQEPLRALIDAWECFDSEAADQNPAPDFTLRNRYRAEIRKLVAALKVATPPKAVTPQEPNG
jgi:hypothetical protein